MSELEIIDYKASLQLKLEDFLEQTDAGPKFPFDLGNKYKDFRSIPEIYQSNNGQFWILFLFKEIAGIIALKSLSEAVGEVKRLNVHPKFRGRGFGELLLKHLLEYASKNKFKKIRLDSIMKHKPALHLYKKYGFYEIFRYNDNPNADIFMEVKLK